MERQTFNILFMLRRGRVGKNGLSPLIVRISTNSLRSEIHIQCHANPQRWNQAKEKATGSDKLSLQVNAYVEGYRAKIMETRQQLITEGLDGNAFEIKERLANPRSASKMFLEELERYCEKRQSEVGVRITQLTANKYHRLLRYLKEYTPEFTKKSDIPLFAVTYEYIDSFNTFMQTVKTCKHNGAVNLLCCLKNFTFYCIRNEWIEKNPFQNYKLRIQKIKNKEHLTKTEVDILVARQMPNKRLEMVRDVFAFCCFTGMAFTDANNLRREHLNKDDQGKLWIRKPREKTSVMSLIPLLPYPISILDKYEGDPLCQEKGKLLPVSSNQKMNAYLKEIATICNIDKDLSTHCARHTFACLAMEFSIPIDVIAKVLGHTNTNMTRRYAKLSQAAIGREMGKFEDAFTG